MNICLKTSPILQFGDVSFHVCLCLHYVGGTLIGTVLQYVSLLCFPSVREWPNHPVITSRWSRRTRGRETESSYDCTSFSAPVEVPRSFSSSVCMELSSCCRIISWNWAIPPLATPLLRPRRARRGGDGGTWFLTVVTYLNFYISWILRMIPVSNSAPFIYSHQSPASFFLGQVKSTP